MPEPRKPFLCRRGLHRRIWFDSAMFFSGDRCGACNDWINPEDGARVERYRSLVEAGLTPFEAADEMVRPPS